MSIAVQSVAERPTATNFLPGAFILGLVVLAQAPRIAGVPRLEASFLGAAALLGLWYLALLVRARLSRRPLAIEFNAVRTHYVQALMQGSIYVAWAAAWPVIGGQILLIVAQWLFVYACTILAGWTHRDKAEVGFGPLPIVLSTNFFMCFRDEWFYLQFAMNAFGVLAKEYVRWTRDGRNTHIFNPSAFGLFCFSVGVILTGSTGLTWAAQNAVELGRPEYIYLHIFIVGLVVQYLFHVTLVTFAAALSLFVLNVVYTQITGVYWFVDAGIPIAVFLGLHLLVTDPATSPRNDYGRFVFGALYGAGVFVLYALLERAGVGRFYDKLLFVPLLNVLVPLIERLTRASALERSPPFAWMGTLASGQRNRVFMGLWIATFAVMYATHFVGPAHPGQDPAFWRSACAEGLHNGCRILQSNYADDCFDGHTATCFELANTVGADGFPKDDRQLRALAYAQACDAGDARGCALFATELARDDGAGLRARCAARNARSCYALGTASLRGLGVAPNREAAVQYFATACDLRMPTACGNLAEMYRYGVGTPKDLPRAVSSYDRACSLGFGGSCVRLAELLATGREVPRDPVRARALFERACRYSDDPRCVVPRV